jgi:rhodanese-related sulfurtransferase
MKWKKVFAEALVLGIVAGVLALAASWLQSGSKMAAGFGSLSSNDQKNIPPESELKDASALANRRKSLQALAPPKDPTLLYLEIHSDTARLLHDAGALFVDSRREGSYIEGHVSKAINIPVWGGKADEGISALKNDGVALDDVIVVYCSGADCSDSLALSEKLAMTGYLNLYIYKEGFPDWKENGWPVATGNTP